MDSFKGKHSDLTSKILRVYYQVYRELGFGFLEASMKKLWSLH